MRSEHITRCGRRAVILASDAPGFWPLMGYVIQTVTTGDEEHEVAHPMCWTDLGTTSFHSDDRHDLMDFPRLAIAAE